MAVDIVFEPDLSRVKAALDRLGAEMQSKPVTVPFGGAAGTGAAGNLPTVTSIFGQPPAISSLGFPGNLGSGSRPVLSASQVSSIFGPGIAPPSAPIPSLASPGFFFGAGVGGGFGGGALTPAGWPAGTGAWGSPIVMPPSGGAPPPGGPPVPPGGGGGGGSFGGPFFGRGFARLAGAGYVAHAVFGALESYREFNIDSMLAGSDQRGQLNATLDYRKRLISSGGWVGQAVGYLQDPSGRAEAEVRSVLAQSESIDSRTKATGRSYEYNRDLRDEAYIAATDNPYEKRFREAEKSYDREVRKHRDALDEKRKADQKYLEDYRVGLDATRYTRASTQLYDLSRPRETRGEAMERLRLEDEQSFAREKASAAAKTESSFASGGAAIEFKYAKARDIINREERVEKTLANIDIFGDIREFEIAAGGNARAAARQRIINTSESANVAASINYRLTNDQREGIAERGRAALAAFDAAGAREDVNQVTSLDIRARANRRAALSDDRRFDFSNAREVFSASVGKAILEGRAPEVIASMIREGTSRIGAMKAEEERQDIASAAVGRIRTADIVKSGSVVESILRRSPLEARLASVEAERYGALVGANARQTVLIDREYDNRRRVAEQQYKDEKDLQLMGLRGEGRVLDVAIRGGHYADIVGKSQQIRESSLLGAEKLKREDPVGNATAIAALMANAGKEQELLGRQFLNRFRAEEFSISRTALGGAEGGNSEILAVLRQIAENTRDNVPRAQ